MIPTIPAVILVSIFGFNFSTTDKTVFNLVNQERVENGVAPVIYSKKLEQSSTRKACDMKKNNYFSHFSPNGKLWEFFTNVDYRYKFAGENLAKDCTDKDCVTLWMPPQTQGNNLRPQICRRCSIQMWRIFSLTFWDTAKHQRKT